jgi:predicted DNA-binding protein
MPRNPDLKPRLIRLCAEHDAALEDLSRRTERSVMSLVREAVAEYTHVPDTARSFKRRAKPIKT